MNIKINSQWPAPLCGHGNLTLKQKDYRIICSHCYSYWDADNFPGKIKYDIEYAQDRAHFNDAIGKLKIRTLDNWIRKLGLNLQGRTICEVGFGGAYCLRFLSEQGYTAMGVEASQAHIDHAVILGLAPEDLFLFDQLPPLLPQPVDLWIFQDSFEHLSNPSAFLRWMCEQSANQAEVLLVAPEAHSLSDLFLGRLWPHRLPDHSFHWSKRGLCELFKNHGFSSVRRFSPMKYISWHSVASHLAFKLGWHPIFIQFLLHYYLIFNIGQMGLLFRKGMPNENQNQTKD